jgi:hypothetical protein
MTQQELDILFPIGCLVAPRDSRQACHMRVPLDATGMIVYSEALTNTLMVKWNNRIEDSCGNHCEWYTYRFRRLSDINISLSCSVPKNNDGRPNCFWCSAPTVKVQGLNEVYDLCPVCKR